MENHKYPRWFSADEMARYKYVIKVNGRKVWEGRGRSFAATYWRIKRKKPKSKISIAVVPLGKETLIVTVFSL